MASKENSGIKNKKKLIAEIKNMNATLIYLSKEINDMASDIKTLMTGDGEDPYWNGADAKIFYQKAIKNLLNDAKDYEAAYNMVNKLAVKAEQAK